VFQLFNKNWNYLRIRNYGKSVQAQFQLGAKAGFTSSNLILSELQVTLINADILQKNNLGTTFGIVGKYVGRKHSGIQVELNYTQRGWTQIFTDSPEEFSTDLNYLDLAVLSHFYIGRGRLKPIVLLGSEINYFLSASEKSFNPEIEDEITYRATDENIRKILFGISVGGGASYDVPFGQFQFDIRFSVGFSNVFDGDVAGTPPLSQNQHLSGQLSFFPKFLNKQKSTSREKPVLLENKIEK
jgi:hypothetical protein